MDKNYIYKFNTNVLQPQVLKSWVGILANFLGSLNVKECKIIFGWHDKLPDKGLPDKEISINNLETELLNQIAQGNILLGEIDFWIECKSPDLSIQFCNDRDIHVDTDDKTLLNKLLKIWDDHGIKYFNNNKKSP